MLGEVLRAPGLLLLIDSAFLTGRRVLYSFIVAALRRAERVHVFGFEVPEEEYWAAVPLELSSSLTFHDGFSNPLNWEKSFHSLTLRDISVQGIREQVGNPAGPVTIVLDSLSWILARCPLFYVCHLLQELSGQQSEQGDAHLVALLHADLHDPGELRSVEQFMVSDDLSLEMTSQMDKEREDNASVDPTVNLTFNLRLSETERKCKESLALPYTFTDSKKTSLLRASSGSAKIFYDPEPIDDMDEDDPDDDLDV
ncbi:elongator complex protein 5 isoform X2 [Eleutherodactylus coqui]|uniref:elongator complex protein 5 isoform X2 n=1 Tax=Eleutherodactylus coqui TaxID=57060 RepID=UPI003462A6ED